MAHWIPELSVAALRPLAESSARRVLVERLDSAGVDAVLADAWERYRALEPEIPDQSTVGAGVMAPLGLDHGDLSCAGRRWPRRSRSA